jgi:hypothetical protein
VRDRLVQAQDQFSIHIGGLVSQFRGTADELGPLVPRDWEDKVRQSLVSMAAHNLPTAMHLVSVAIICDVLLQYLNSVPAERRFRILLAASLHDLAKRRWPCHSFDLSASEFKRSCANLQHQHPRQAYEEICAWGLPWQEVAYVVLLHHQFDAQCGAYYTEDELPEPPRGTNFLELCDDAKVISWCDVDHSCRRAKGKSQQQIRSFVRSQLFASFPNDWELLGLLVDEGILGAPLPSDLVGFERTYEKELADQRQTKELAS